MDQIETRIADRVAVVALHRPAQGNRVTQRMAEELSATLEQLARDASVGACVLTGSGDAFCLGGDHVGAGKESVHRMAFTRAFSDAVLSMARLGKPLVAAVNGNAHAGGFCLVGACDLAVMAQDASMGLPEVEKNFFPLLALAVVRHTMPRKVFFDLAYNARLLTAQESRELHLVNEVVERGNVLSRAMQIARKLATREAVPIAIGRGLWHSTQALSLEEALEHARMAVVAGMAAGDDVAERRA